MSVFCILRLYHKIKNWEQNYSALLNTTAILLIKNCALRFTLAGVQSLITNLTNPFLATTEAKSAWFSFLAADADGAMELIRNCWGTMLKKGAKTFWEFAPTNADERWPIPAHAWSGGCTYLLSAYVLGIRPLTPGYASAVFQPYMGMKSFKGVVSVCRGLIAASCTTENDILAISKGIEPDIQIEKEDAITIRQY